jgi:uncharacterized protein (TIGR02246 family)
MGLVLTWPAHLGLPPNTEASMTSARSFRSWLSLTVLLVLVAPSLASGQGIERPRVPIRTAIAEIRSLRAGYEAAYNKKDSATVADMYAPDAIVIQGDGSVLVGKDAIRKSLATDAPTWPKMTITSDTVQVFGNTAYDVGTTRSQRSAGGEEVSHYLVVLRRGMKEWTIKSLAVVPERRTKNAADSAAH